MISETRLRYLYESARLGTMRAASEKLEVATSSVSRQIAKLEKELDIALIEKGRHGIKLTEAGEAAYMYYRDKISLEEGLYSKIGELKNMLSGNIYLALGTVFISQQFSDILQTFTNRYPDIDIHILTDTTSTLLQHVQQDEAHIGLVFAPPPAPDIRIRLSLPTSLKVIVCSTNPLSDKKIIRLSDITHEKIGMLEEGYRIRQIIRNAEQEDGTYLKSSMTTNYISLLADFVVRGRGIAILPEIVVQSELMSGKLKAIPTDSRILNATEAHLITRVGRQLPIAAQRLLISIESFLKDMIRAFKS